jgi:glycosyltransferase involved in cell wall biosynthesis
MLAIDLTPTVINRTAIFHIALDTSAALARFVGKFRYGRTYADVPITDRRALDAKKKQILEAIFSGAGLARERWRGILESSRRRPVAVSRIFFFDPLYTLFEDVTRDDIVLVLDLTTVTNPEWHDPRVSALYQIAFRRIAASGARIASISENTAWALRANYGIPVDEVSVVPLYLRRAFVDDTPLGEDARTKTLLFVGSLETRKNISGLLKAFEISRLSADGFRLVIVGGDGIGASTIKSLAVDIPGTELRGFVADDELNSLYRTARAFVYPSYLEGFGVPILEASSAGLPILTSTTGATAEFAPPGSTLVDPYDTPAIADGLRRIALLDGDEVSAIRARNREHARQFSFERYLDRLSSVLSLG